MRRRISFFITKTFGFREIKYADFWFSCSPTGLLEFPARDFLLHFRFIVALLQAAAEISLMLPFQRGAVELHAQPGPLGKIYAAAFKFYPAADDDLLPLP